MLGLDGKDWTLILISSAITAAISYFVYYLSKQPKKLSYSYRVRPLINLSLPKLTVSYDGNAIKTLYLVQLYLWNSGKATISRANLASGSLRVTLDSEMKATVLATDVASSTRPETAVNLTAQGSASNTIHVDFRFLDPRDGCLIEIPVDLGEKPSSKPTGVELTGVITGAPSSPQFVSSNIALRDPIGDSVLPFLGTGMIGLSVGWAFISLLQRDNPSLVILIVAGLFSALCLAASVSFLLTILFAPTVPKALRRHKG